MINMVFSNDKHGVCLVFSVGEPKIYCFAKTSRFLS